nr:hypothetical protein [Odoribacter splanchnicus]
MLKSIILLCAGLCAGGYVGGQSSVSGCMYSPADTVCYNGRDLMQVADLK